MRRWRERLLAVAFLSLGVGILAGALLTWLVPVAWAPLAAMAILWIGMLAPVVYGFTRSRPIGLLRFRGVDLLYAIALGGLLRIVQGWIDAVTGGSGALPSYPVIGGNLPSGWLLTDLIAPGLIAPVLEEFFFRAILLVALFTVFRRSLGSFVAGLVAVLGSTGVFVLSHGIEATSTSGILGIFALGATCAALVILTGRIWGAVLVHIVFNLTFVALALVGTIAG